MSEQKIIITDAINTMKPEDRMKVYKFAGQFRELIAGNAPHAQIAFALVGAEMAEVIDTTGDF